MATYRREVRTLGSLFPPFPDRDSGSDSESDSGSCHPGSELNRSKYRLKDAIDEIQTHGDFATKKQYSLFANPGLQIGDCMISLPLDTAQVPSIRDASRQAPFGRGAQTLVDTSVRDTWELDASKFRITNPAWSEFLNQVLQHVSESMGMSSVRAELYKLLLYDKGSFFKRHRDSEKAPGMIATLSICLPSRYKGGEVHLSHTGKNCVFDTSQSIFDVSALAWYADVTHEIKPVQKGHRLVLIYNIIRTSEGANSADFFVKQDQKLQAAIARLNLHSLPKRLLYFLDHKYSQTSLQIDQLKGRDRAVVQALRDGCARNSWYVFLCNVTKRSDGDYHRGFDYDCYYGDIGPELVMDTVATCSSQIIAAIVELDKKDILGPDPYKSPRAADSESEGEDTGNEGPAMEYRYHDSAVMMVPKARLDQFFDFGVRMKVLNQVVIEDFEAHPNDPVTRKTATDFLSKAVTRDFTTSPLVLAFAWRMKEDNLFRTAVRAGLTGGVPGTGIIDALVKIVKNEPVGRTDWDKIFSQFVSSHTSLTKLKASLDAVKSLLDSDKLQASFLQWRSMMHILSFENKKTLAADDHEAVLDLAALQWENVGWIRNKLVPKICNCCDKKFLSKFICSLLQKDREGILDKAKDIASVLLQSEFKKLRLATVKFNSMAGDYDDWHESQRFCQLLSDCLQSGLYQDVDELLRLSLNTIRSAPVNDGSAILRGVSPYMVFQTKLADEMLRGLCEKFEEYNMPLPSEPARDFAIAILRKFVVKTLPQWPVALQGQSHKPRGCGKCKHCEELDSFLASQTEREREFRKGPRISEHLQAALPLSLFQCTETILTDGKPSQHLLKVVKLGQEHQAALDEYEKDLGLLFHRVRPFRTEYVKKLLGDDMYSELITLDQLPRSKEISEKSEQDAQALLKRQAEETEFAARKRMKHAGFVRGSGFIMD